MFLPVIAICVGAAFGALLRWVLSTQLNALFPLLPPSTLTTNLLNDYLVEMTVAFFANHPSLPPEWRLFIVTKFLRKLTTFSTFSAEVVAQLIDRRLG